LFTERARFKTAHFKGAKIDKKEVKI
jgi:hypothetical protein